jgi:hypothetical protein
MRFADPHNRVAVGFVRSHLAGFSPLSTALYRLLRRPHTITPLTGSMSLRRRWLCRPARHIRTHLADLAAMAALLARLRPVWEPGTEHGYLTFGWLVGEFVRRHTGLTGGGVRAPPYRRRVVDRRAPGGGGAGRAGPVPT